MSINFNNTMNDEARAMLKELFGDELVATDEKTALVNTNTFLQKAMSDLARTAKQPITIDNHSVGEVKEMRDGTKYRATSRGWVKIK